MTPSEREEALERQIAEELDEFNAELTLGYRVDTAKKTATARIMDVVRAALSVETGTPPESQGRDGVDFTLVGYVSRTTDYPTLYPDDSDLPIALYAKVPRGGPRATAIGSEPTLDLGSYTILREAVLEYLDEFIIEDDVAEESIFYDAIKAAAAEIERLRAPMVETGTTMEWFAGAFQEAERRACELVEFSHQREEMADVFMDLWHTVIGTAAPSDTAAIESPSEPDALGICERALSALDRLMGDTDSDNEDDPDLIACQGLADLVMDLRARAALRATPVVSNPSERLARDIVLAVIGMPRIKPHPDLVAKVVFLLRQEGR